MKLPSVVRLLAIAAAGLVILMMVVVSVTINGSPHQSQLPEVSGQAKPVTHSLTSLPRQPSLSPSLATSSTGVTLPPSHDNDAGMSRAHDQFPDADIDFYQRFK